ncbi:hypothetical protein Nepgr_001176 [Nepenthes gracilis]|uniref:Uncharacterized protein n=1 Tax=Nepenthes gracilis TaxID=150966 RepID=A0AAD3P4U6_NEPGR|nr:hypothetical protein Nepgr_001176 [Nepenthes gracilis]
MRALISGCIKYFERITYLLLEMPTYTVSPSSSAPLLHSLVDLEYFRLTIDVDLPKCLEKLLHLLSMKFSFFIMSVVKEPGRWQCVLKG